MIYTIPPRGHFAEARITPVLADGHELIVGTAEFGNGTTTVHTQIAAAVLNSSPAAPEVSSLARQLNVRRNTYVINY